MRSIHYLAGFGMAGLLWMVGANIFAVNTSDETAIRASVMGFQEAWDHHDMKAMADVFTEDANLINVLGTRWQGRADIVKALGVYHRVMFNPTTNWEPLRRGCCWN